MNEDNDTSEEMIDGFYRFIKNNEKLLSIIGLWATIVAISNISDDFYPFTFFSSVLFFYFSLALLHHNEFFSIKMRNDFFINLTFFCFIISFFYIIAQKSFTEFFLFRILFDIFFVFYLIFCSIIMITNTFDEHLEKGTIKKEAFVTWTYLSCIFLISLELTFCVDLFLSYIFFQ